MTKKLCLLLLSSVFLFVGCKSSQKAVSSDSTQSKSASQQSLLWELSSDQTDTKSYLFGTMHMMPKEDYVMPDTIKHLLSSCKKLILEIDYSAMNKMDANIMGLMQKALLTDGKTVKDYLSEEDYNILSARMEKLGIPMFMADRIKPFFLSLIMDMDGINQLSEMASYEMELGKMAQKNGLETGGLETVGDQMQLFDEISVEDQADMLSKSLHSDPSDGNQSQLDSLIAIYKSQDIDRLEEYVIEADKTMAMNKAVFLDNRNENWIPLIQDEMGQGAAFIAVGAGHLGGKKGVVKLLKKAGIKVTPIIFKFHDSKDRQK